MHDSFTPLFGLTLMANMMLDEVIVGGLSFFPALALGPIAEHFAMAKGVLYAAP
jgi:potassium-transporting ATPase potassium-binding subunit